MEKITINAYAKINLWLEVLGKRPDGYHGIKSIMQTVSLCDYITLMKTNDGLISLSGTDPLLSYGKDNLAYRAADCFFYHNCHLNCGVKINIEKNIPIGAGLAGGSADAAAVLLGLNKLFSTSISEENLCEIGKEIGSDVPFCIVGGTAYACGRGEIIKKIKPINIENCVIAKGKRSVSTAKAYLMLDQKNDEKSEFDISDYLDGTIDVFPLYNSFESVVSEAIPDVSAIKKEMSEYGAASSLMSGSGPAVFGIFDKYNDAISCRDALIKQGFFATYCNSIR